MLISKCIHCIHSAIMENYQTFSKDPDIKIPTPCNSCIHIASDNFESKEKYYPLELSNGHINLWGESGKSKISIAFFTNTKSYEGADLIFVADRPFDPRVDWVNFKTLIKIGYENHKTEGC